MDIRKRLFRKPFTTFLWLLVVILMTGFLTVGVTLKYSSEKLAEGLDEKNTAIAVRTDPSLEYVNGGFMVSSRRFTRADAEALEALPQVKAVRNNSLGGAYSEKFVPITETSRYMGWASKGDIRPYSYMTIAGLVVDHNEFNDVTVLDVVAFSIPMLYGELSDVDPILKNIGVISVEIESDDPAAVASWFEIDKKYVFSGVFDPLRWEWRYNSRYVLSLGKVSIEDGYLIGRFPGFEKTDIPEGLKYEPYSFPAAELLYKEGDDEHFYLEEPPESDIETFFNNTKHEIWRDYRKMWQLQQHSLPMIGTDRLESMFVFVRGEAEIVEGRSFTPEEYASGEHSLIISEKTAQLGGVAVGDTIVLRQFLCEGDPEMGTNPSTLAQEGAMLSNPEIDLIDLNRPLGEEEEFTVVGIYRLNGDWNYGTYSITPNTLFIPRAAQIEGAFCTIPPAGADPGSTTDVYGPYLSIELNNGSADDFRYELSRSPYAGQFYEFDQGFETVQKNLNELSKTSGRLMWIAAAGWVLLFALFLLMYQGGQKQNIGTMRSLGRRPYQAAFYLFASGLIVVALGVLFGTLIGKAVLDSVQTKIVAETVGSVDIEADAVVMTAEELSELVKNSIPGVDLQLKLGVAQLVVMAVFMLIQAAAISRMGPRELIDA